MRVLFVEDNPDDAELMLLELRRAGLRVEFERVETEAAMNAALDAHSWCIVISDFSLPQFGGLAALELVKRRGLDLPFILVSGNVGEEIAVTAMKAGASDYVMKGNLARLAPAVQRELRDAAVRREARQTELHLHERDAQLAEAQRLAHVGSWHWDAATDRFLWSDEIHRIFASEPQQPAFTFEAFLQLVHPGDRPLLLAPWRSASHQFALDFRIVRPDETIRFVHARGKVIRDERGEPVQAVGMFQDITERKLAELELTKARDELEARVKERTVALSAANAALEQQIAERLQAEQLLRESEKRARLIIDSALDALITADARGAITGWNPRAEAIFGWAAHEVMGKSLAEIIIPPQYRAAHTRGIERFLTSGEGPVLNKLIEVTGMRRDGKEFPVELAISAIQLSDGYTFSAFVRDITERKAAQTELEVAKRAAESANQSKSDFLANMSHEIRTPMTAILGYADMLLAPGQSPSDRLDCIHTIRRQSEHLLSILNDILDLSKIEAGRLEVERIECDPCSVISDAVSLMRVRAIEKNLVLAVSYTGPIPKQVQTDPTRFRQILINLIGNAIKFTQTGGVQVVASMEHDPVNARSLLRLEISDSGIGMTPGQIDHLFQPFAQGDTSTTRRFGGSGLGLSICKRLAQALGGDISVQSRPGCGSRFTVTLEVGDLEGVEFVLRTREAINETPKNEKTPAPVVKLNGRILLAEDGVHNQRVITFYLQEAGAEVTIADNGRVACEKAMEAQTSGRPFDIILMDMQMPELDGYSAAATLRSKGYSGPIVALTAHAMAGDRAKCVRAGCSDYLSKPIDKRKLLETIAEYLHTSVAARRAIKEIEVVERFVEDAPAPAATGPIRSDRASDPDLARFLPTFVADLPAQVQHLLTLAREADVDALCKALHQIKGCGGLYGFQQMSDLAERAEERAAARSIEAAKTEVAALIDLIRRIEGYDRSKEAAAR